MVGPTDAEQLLIELANRARANPAGEVGWLVPGWGSQDAPEAPPAAQANIQIALDFYATDLDRFAAQMAAFEPAPPLAWSEALARSAETHSLAMIEADTQAHRLPGEPDLVGRTAAAGYENPAKIAENLFAFAEDPVHAHASFVIDWGAGPGGIQDPAGHREALLDPQFTEIGLGYVPVPDPDQALGPFALTQHLGVRFGATAALTGVVTSDGDEDGFYDIGEGLGGVEITALGPGGPYATTSFASGGYTLDLPPGDYTVIFANGGLEGTVIRDVAIGAENVKADVEYLEAVPDGAILGTRGDDAGLSEPADPLSQPQPGWLAGTGSADEIRALEGDDLIVASAGDDLISGGFGDDTLVYRGTTAAHAVTLAEGTVTVAGPDGTDTLAGIERLDFADANVLLDVASGNAGFALRIYTAVFGRLPGEDGFRFWAGRLDDGLSQKDVAERFAASAEFAERYGEDPTDAEFITALYQNVLGRAPGQGGFDFYMNRLATGASDRADLLVTFAESPENVASSEPLLANGVTVANGPDDFDVFA